MMYFYPYYRPMASCGRRGKRLRLAYVNRREKLYVPQKYENAAVNEVFVNGVVAKTRLAADYQVRGNKIEQIKKQ